MSDSTRNRLILGGLVAVVIVFALATLNPFDSDQVSKDDVKALCDAGGVGSAAAVATWKTPGRIKIAAALAGSLGYYQCSAQLGRIAESPTLAPG